jgi:hypothetical protein
MSEPFEAQSKLEVRPPKEDALADSREDEAGLFRQGAGICDPLRKPRTRTVRKRRPAPVERTEEVIERTNA